MPRIMGLEHARYTMNTNRLMCNELPTQGKAGSHLQHSQEIISQAKPQHLQGWSFTPNEGSPFHIKTIVVLRLPLHSEPKHVSLYLLLYRAE